MVWLKNFKILSKKTDTQWIELNSLKTVGDLNEHLKSKIGLNEQTKLCFLYRGHFMDKNDDLSRYDIRETDEIIYFDAYKIKSQPTTRKFVARHIDPDQNVIVHLEPFRTI